jgi:prepilin-type N-terminal cleavage/methylation domain-containing protein
MLRHPVPSCGAWRRRFPAGWHGRTGACGFTLLEVLVALMIATLGLGAMFQAAAGGLRNGAAASRYTDALSRARSHLDSAGVHLMSGDQQGDDGDGFRWRVLTRAVGSTGRQDSAGRAVDADTLVVTLYAITVWISWSDGTRGRLVRLDSARLATSGPPSRS